MSRRHNADHEAQLREERRLYEQSIYHMRQSRDTAGDDDDPDYYVDRSVPRDERLRLPAQSQHHNPAGYGNTSHQTAQPGSYRVEDFLVPDSREASPSDSPLSSAPSTLDSMEIAIEPMDSQQEATSARESGSSSPGELGDTMHSCPRHVRDNKDWQITAQCDYKFTSREAMDLHVRNVHDQDEDRFQCRFPDETTGEKCDSWFEEVEDIVKHQNTVHGVHGGGNYKFKIAGPTVGRKD